MTNEEIAGLLYEMADLSDLQDYMWPARAFRAAARTLEGMGENVSDIYKKKGEKGLQEIPGIGSGISKKIVQFLKTGRIDEHERLKRKVPRAFTLMLTIPGMGPKKIKKLHSALKITTIAQLTKACKDHKVAGVPGFGDKSEHEILESIALMKLSKGRVPLQKAQKEAKAIIFALKKLKEVKKIEVAGSLRRKKETIGDIDILVSTKRPQIVIAEFTKLKKVKKVLAKGPTKGAIIMKSGIQVDLRVLAPESWGAGLFYFTGGKSYNIQVRKIAIKKGYKLNEYGLFDRKTGKMVAGKTEQELCKKIGIPYIKPEHRGH